MRIELTPAQRMNLATRLLQYRKRRGLTQQQMADELGVHITQIKRYEAGTSQPSIDGLKKIAVLLSVSTDELIFGDTGRDPAAHLKLHFEAVARLNPDEQQTVLNVIDGLMLKHQALQLFDRPAIKQAPAAKPANKAAAAKRMAHAGNQR